MSDLSALLEREASAEIEAIVSEARDRAAALMAEAQAEAEQLLAQRRRAAEARREAELLRARSAAELEAAAVRLHSRHEAVAAVFEAARERLAALPANARSYRAVLRRLLAEAVDSVGTAEVASVQAAPSDLEAVRAAVKAMKLEVPVEGDEAVSLGIRLRTKGRSSVENTLPGRLQALEAEATGVVSRSLFGEDAAEGAERAPPGASDSESQRPPANDLEGAPASELDGAPSSELEGG